VTRTAIAIGDATIAESDSGTSAATFVITRSGNTSGTSSVKYTSVGGTAATGIDFVGVSLTTLAFSPGETSKTVTASVKGDGTPETDEAFALILSAPVGAVITDDKGVGTITNDDGVPSTVSVDDVTVMEGNSGTTFATFTITRWGDASGNASVRYLTGSSSAVAGEDFEGLSLTTVSFAPGETSKSVTVTVYGDAEDEPNQAFTVNLYSSIGVVLADAKGVGTIVNDDVSIIGGPATFLRVDDVLVMEGSSGSTPATFTITRSGDTTSPSSVQYTSVAGTATGGSD
jgi:hypothetical protein